MKKCTIDIFRAETNDYIDLYKEFIGIPSDGQNFKQVGAGYVSCGQCGRIFHEDNLVLRMEKDGKHQFEHCPYCDSTGKFPYLEESEGRI